MNRHLWRRLAATACCFALTWSSAGPSAYAAAGQAVSHTPAGRAGAPVAAVSLPKISLTLPVPGQTLGSDLTALDLALPAHLPVANAAAAFAQRAAQKAALAVAPISVPQVAAASALPGQTAVAPVTGPGKTANPERIAAKLEGLRRLWPGQKIDSDDSPLGSDQQAPANQLPRGPPAQSDDGSATPPAPPAPPSGGSNDKGWFGLGKTAVLFIAALLLAQFGLEAWGASWAKWVQVNYGVGQYSLMTTVTMIVSLAAGFLGGWAADKIGLKRTYLITAVAGAVAAAVTLLLFKFGGLAGLPFWLLVTLSSLRVFMGSAGRTAEQTIPIAIYKDNKDGLVRYNSISQFILEIAGIAVPYSIGMMLAWWGAIGTMMLFPIAAILAGTLFLFLVKIPEFNRKTAAGKANLAADQKEKHDPALLKIASLAYPAFALLNMLLYGILAIGYGNFVHPGTTPVEQAMAAGVAGKIVALYSLGGLFAAFFLSGLHKDLWRWLKGKWNKRDGKLAAEPAAAEDPNAALRSAMRWSFLGALGLLGFVPFIWTSPMLAALAMIPFGYSSVMGQLHMLSLIQSNVPQEKKGKVMGTVRTVGTLLATGGILGFGHLFQVFPASAVPFWIMLGVFAVIGAYYVWMGVKLKRYLAKKPLQ